MAAPEEPYPRSEQYKALVPLYELEEARYEQLNSRAQLYLTLLSGLTLFAGLKTDDLVEAVLTSRVTEILALIGGTLALVAIAYVGHSLVIRNYSELLELTAFTQKADEQRYTEQDFYSILLRNLSIATDKNRRVNNQRALSLQRGSWAIGGVIAVFIALNIVIVVTDSRPHVQEASKPCVSDRVSTHTAD